MYVCTYSYIAMHLEPCCSLLLLSTYRGKNVREIVILKHWRITLAIPKLACIFST